MNSHAFQIDTLTPAELNLFKTATKDLTLYWASTLFVDEMTRQWPVEAELRQVPLRKATLARLQAFDERVALNHTPGRACICLCFANRYCSATFRLDQPFPWYQPWTKPAPWKYDINHDCKVETREIVEQLWSFVVPTTTAHRSVLPAGLVIVSGGTNSAKSNVAKAFSLSAINRLVGELAPGRPISVNGQAAIPPATRLPHLVTYEDPIESWTIYSDGAATSGRPIHIDSPQQAALAGFCMTPRQSRYDVADLRSALRDALRQTPACFFVGEVRDGSEWDDILTFAASGHLIVVTTHASSLVEAMSKILSARGTATAAARRASAAHILACVHLRMSEDGLYPTVWTREHGGLNPLVGDGLSSISPNGTYVLSRQDFLHRIKPNPHTDLLRAARQLDAQELRTA